jgi:hypothetical protein
MKNKYIDRTEKIPLVFKDQTQVSFPTKFTDKATIIDELDFFPAHNNKLAPLVNEILKLPKFQT